MGSKGRIIHQQSISGTTSTSLTAKRPAECSEPMEVDGCTSAKGSSGTAEEANRFVTWIFVLGVV